MKKQKWYLWNGKGEIPQGVEAVVFRDGLVCTNSNAIRQAYFWSDNNDDADIIAYTKGEMV